MSAIEIIAALLSIPILIGAMAAGCFVLWIIGTAIYYLVCYGRLP